MNFESINSFLPFLIIGGGGIWVYFLTRKSSGKKLEPKRIVHDLFQQKTVDKLESVQIEKTKVVAEVKNLENQSVETQQEIRRIIDNAAVKIQIISKRNTVLDVNSEADKNWEDL